MTNIFSFIIRRFKRRKYPITRDETGRSLRQRAFAFFKEGLRPAQVIEALEREPGHDHVNRRTIFRYFEDWKRLRTHSVAGYVAIRKIMKNDTGFRDNMIDLIAGALEMTREQVITKMHTPWAIKQLLLGKWPNPKRDAIQTKRERHLQVALQLVNFMENFGDMSADRIEAVIKRFIDEARRARAGEIGPPLKKE